jgi:hypothetical protein
VLDPLHFIAAASNGRMAQTRNLAEALYTATTPLQGQQTGKAAAALLIQRHQHPVNRPVLLGDCTVWVRLTGQTGAPVFNSLRLAFHSLSLTIRRIRKSLRPTGWV